MSIRYSIEKSFTFKKVNDILNNVNSTKVSSAPPVGDLKPNEVFVYQVHLDTAWEFWRHDGFRWKNLRSQGYPKTDPWCRRVTQQLLINGENKDFWRREYYPFNAKVSPPNNWRIPYVVVHYYGSFDFQQVDSDVHGNSIPTPLKTSSKVVREILGEKTPEKDTGSEKGLAPRMNRVAKKRTGGYYNKSGNQNAPPPSDDEERSPTPCPMSCVQVELHSTPPQSEAGCAFSQEINEKSPSASSKNSVSRTERSVSQRRAFKRVYPSVKIDVMKKLKSGKTPSQAYREVTRESILEDGDNTKIPRNLKQVYNIQQQLRKEQQHDDIFEAYLFGKQHPDVVVNLQLIPQLVMVQLHPQMTEHVLSLMSKYEHLVFHYDTTFDIGPFYTSILSLRHPAFKGEPLIPVAVMFHQTTSGSCHEMFFKAISEILMANKNSTVIITDRERSIRNAIKSHLSEAQHLFCWNHLRRNVNDWVMKNMKSAMAFDYSSQVFGLLQSESYDEFMSTLETSKKNWDPIFTEYFEKHLKLDLLTSFRPILTRIGVYSPISGITNNPAESTNAVLKRNPGLKNATLFQALSTWYFHQAYRLLEIRQGFQYQGDFIFNGTPPEKIFVPEGLDDILPNSMTKSLIFEGKYPADLSTSKEYKSKSVHEATTLRGLARFFIRNDRVKLLAKNGTFIVNGLLGKTFMVNLKDASCSCLRAGICEHRLSAMISAGVDGKLKLKRCQPNLGKVYRKTVRKATGKKQGQRYRVRLNLPKTGQVPLGSKIITEAPITPLESFAGRDPVVLNENKLKLPLLNYNNLDMTLLSLPTGNVWLKEVKTVQPELQAGERKLLTKSLGRDVDDDTVNWMVDSVLAGFLLKITNCESQGVISVTPPETLLIFSKEDSSSLFCKSHENKEDYHDWSTIKQILIPFNLDGNHWILIVLKPETAQILVLDPSESFRLSLSQLTKLQQTFNPKYSFPPTVVWDVKYPSIAVSSGDKALECGPFVCFYAEATIRGWSYMSMPDVKEYRNHIITTLIGNCQPFADKRRKTCNKCSDKVSDNSNCDFCKRKSHKSCLQKIMVREREYYVCY